MTQASTIPGGRYRAEQAADGTWRIFDVPVFAELPKGVKGAPRDIRGDELRECVRVALQKSEREAFLAPLHIYHQEQPTPSEPAGFFLPRRVASYMLDGEIVDTIFADLVGVPDGVFREIDRARFPYRSVEIRSWEPLEFGGLALLDSQDPYFRFPLLTIGDRQPLAAGSVQQFARGPLRAFAPVGAGAVALFRFSDKEASMADEPKKDDPKEKKDGEKSFDGGELKGAVDTITKAAEALSGLIPALQKLVQPAGAGGGEAAPAEGPAQMAEDDDDDRKKAQCRAVDPEVRAELAATKDRVKKLERDREVETFVAGAKKALEAKGFEVSEDTEKDLVDSYRVGKAEGDRFVATYARIAQKDPAKNLADAVGAAGRADPAEVAKFAAEGPEPLAAARKYSALYDQAVTRGFVNPKERSREAFIRSQFRAEKARF